MSLRPNLAWQTAFCAATRPRLAELPPAPRASLLVACATLGLHMPAAWLDDFFAACTPPSPPPPAPPAAFSALDSGEPCLAAAPAALVTSPAAPYDGTAAGFGGDLEALDATQQANVLWGVACLTPDPPPAWLQVGPQRAVGRGSGLAGGKEGMRGGGG
jgi:hypothetical protein